MTSKINYFTNLIITTPVEPIVPGLNGQRQETVAVDEDVFGHNFRELSYLRRDIEKYSPAMVLIIIPFRFNVEIL